MSSDELAVKSPCVLVPEIAFQGTMDHIFEVLASHNHPFILIGCSAQRWMGSAGAMIDSCDLLVRDGALKSVASSLVKTTHWEIVDSVPKTHQERFPCIDWQPDADIVLEATETGGESGYEYLALWSETTYRMQVDNCPLVEVPDVYAWNHVLIEEKWHPAIDRTDGWWFGPRLRPDTNTPNLPEYATLPTLFPKGLQIRKSPSNPHPIFIPSLPAYLDVLAYHEQHYKVLKPGLATLASLQIRNLTRYLYLELPHQQLPLMIEMEEYDYMDNYLQKHKRKPVYVYRAVPGGVLESVRVKEWDPSSYPDWCSMRN